MLKGNGVEQEQLSLDSLLLDEVCVCCEALTKLLVQKGVISWDELLTMAKTATIERRCEKKELANSARSAERKGRVE
jgi:hypothetical protein